MTKPAGGEAEHRRRAVDLKPDTKLATGGRAPFKHLGYVNTPVYHASTLLYRTAENFLARRGQVFLRPSRLGDPHRDQMGARRPVHPN